MDALVKLVLERLEKRMTSTATFMVTECNGYDEHILLQNQLISFAGIDYGHLRELMCDTLVPWVAYLYSTYISNMAKRRLISIRF